MYAEFEELKKLSEHTMEMERDRDLKKRELDRLCQLQENLKADVERLKEFQALQKKQTDVNAKLLWRKAFTLAAEHAAKKEALKTAKDARKVAEKALAEAEVPLRREQEHEKAAATAQSASNKAKSEGMAAKDKAVADVETLITKTDDIADKISSTEEAHAQRVDAARTAKNKHTVAVAELAKKGGDAENETAIAAKLAAAEVESREAVTAKDDLHELIRDHKRRQMVATNNLARAEQQLKGLDDANALRNSKLQQDADGRAALKLREWIQKNASLFEEEVIGPVGLDCEASDAEGAKYLEVAIPKQVLTGFLTFTAKDRVILNKHVQDNKINLNVYRFERNQSAPRSPFDAHAPELQQMGVAGFLSERLKASKDVTSFLVDFNGLHKMLVGRAGLNEKVTQLQNLLSEKYRTDAFTLYLPTTVFSATKSRYGSQAVSTQSRPLRPRPLFFGPAALADPTERTRVQKLVDDSQAAASALATTQHELRKAEVAADAALSDIRQRKIAIGNEARLGRQLAIRVSDLAESAEAAQRNAAPAYKDKEQATLRADLSKLLDRLAAKSTEVASAHAKLALIELDAQCAVLGMRQAFIRTRALKDSTEAALAARNLAIRDEDAIKAAQSRAQNLMNKAVEVAFDSAPHFADANPSSSVGLQGEFLQRWDDLPEDDDALADELEEVKKKIGTSSADMGSITVFNENATKISALEKSVSEFENNAQNQADDLASRRAAWEPKVNEMAIHVSKKFGEYFTAFNCSGEVGLKTCSNIKDYALEIRVKWRSSEELHVLAVGGRDSGGERSVATMVYLIALQDINPCPFRVVDEINQAMDPTNEKRIFECITRAVASQASKTQYFLITPKLLPDLHYSTQTSMHFIYNGPYMQPAGMFALDVSAKSGGDRSHAISPDESDEA